MVSLTDNVVRVGADTSFLPVVARSLARLERGASWAHQLYFALGERRDEGEPNYLDIEINVRLDDGTAGGAGKR